MMDTPWATQPDQRDGHTRSQLTHTREDRVLTGQHDQPGAAWVGVHLKSRERLTFHHAHELFGKFALTSLPLK